MNASQIAAPPQRTLRDRVRLLRRYGRMLVVMVVLGAGVAVGLAVRQDEVYTSSLTMDFLDPTRQVGVIGGQASNTSAATFASQGVSRITSDKTLREVKQQLKTNWTVSEIRDHIAAATDPATFAVTLTAKAPSAGFAADLANAIAVQTKLDADAAAARQFATVAKQFDVQIRHLTPAQKANPLAATALIDQRSRAQALANGGATAASIQAPARPPSSPSSPKPILNGVLGGVLGLLLGLALAGLRESFDRRLRDSREVESELALPIIGHVPETALGKTQNTTNGAAKLTAQDLEAFRILRTNVEFLDISVPLRTVAVTSALPEEGKSTVATSLAFASAAAGRQTLLVECDLRRPTFAKRLGIAPSPGITDFLRGAAQPAEILQSITIGVRPDMTFEATSPGQDDALGTLVCITAGSPSLTPAELLASNRFATFLKQVSEAYDLVVVDTSPLLPVADTLEIVPNVDAVLLCVRASRTTRDQAAAARATLARFPERPTGIVVTGARDRGEYASSGYYAGYNYTAPAASTDA